MTRSPVEHIETYLEWFGISDDELGIVLGPRVDHRNELGIEYSIRVLDGELAGHVQIDGRYDLEGVSTDRVFEDVYPELLEEFETAFPDAKFQYYDLE